MFAEGLEADAQTLLVDRAERLVARREVGILENIPELRGDVFGWKA